MRQNRQELCQPCTAPLPFVIESAVLCTLHAAWHDQHVCWHSGIAATGYVPHVAPNSSIVTFATSLTGVSASNIEAWAVQFPSAVVNATNSPDTTVIYLDNDASANNSAIVYLAVAFNLLPSSDAQLAAALFINKLKAAQNSSSVMPFPAYSSVSAQNIVGNVTQQNATAGTSLSPNSD